MDFMFLETALASAVDGRLALILWPVALIALALLAATAVWPRIARRTQRSQRRTSNHDDDQPRDG